MPRFRPALFGATGLFLLVNDLLAGASESLGSGTVEVIFGWPERPEMQMRPGGSNTIDADGTGADSLAAGARVAGGDAVTTAGIDAGTFDVGVDRKAPAEVNCADKSLQKNP